MKYLAGSIFLALTLTTGATAHADGQDLIEPVGAYRSPFMALKTAAELGDAQAQFELGQMYESGQGAFKSRQSAAYWYQRAAVQGHPDAQARLGVFFGGDVGMAHDDVQAVYWFKKAALQGLASAQYNLAYMYAQGRGVPKDDRLAIEWYRRAADQGNARAQYNLGEIYSKGIGVPKDNQQAYFWWLLASAQGFPSAIEKRDFLELRLSPEMRAAAQAEVRALKRPSNGTAQVVPAPTTPAAEATPAAAQAPLPAPFVAEPVPVQVPDLRTAPAPLETAPKAP